MSVIKSFFKTPTPPKMLKRAVGWLKDKAGGGGRASGKKRSRDAYEEEQEEEEVNVWADDHLMYACPPARQEQSQQHQQHSRPGQKLQSSLSSSASEGEELYESYEDVDLSSDAGDDGQDNGDREKKTDEASPLSPPPPSYFSFAAAAGLRPEAPSSLLSRGPSERVLPLIKRARHTQTHFQGDGMLYLEAPISTTTTNSSSSTTSNNISAIPDIYLDFFDVFDLPHRHPPSQQQQQEEEEEEHDQGSDDGNNGTVVDGEEEEEEEEEEELRRLADTKADHDDDDEDIDAHSPCSSPLFPPLAAKSEEVDASHHAHAQGGNGDAEFVLTASAAPAFGTSIRRPYHSAASSSPSTVIYTFTSELALRALVAPEALGIGGPGGEQSNEEGKEEDDEDSLFGRQPAKSVPRSGVLAGWGQSTSVSWERVEALVDCKVEVSEEGSCVAAGPDLQSSGVPLLFGIESETFWGMEELVCVNLYRSVDQLGTRSLLLLAKHASQRPPWAPERLEIVVVPLQTKGHEQNAAAMLSLLSPAQARGPVKGGGLEAKLHVFEGRGELRRRPELPDLVALLEGHDYLLQRVGCERNGKGSQYKRKQE